MIEENTFIIRSRAVITHDDRLLVVKHTNHDDKHDDFYTLPGGHLDYGEEPVECIEREIVEELGVNPTIGKLLYVHTYTDKGVQPIEFFYEVLNGENYLNTETLKGIHAHEIAEIRWVGKDEEINFLPHKLYEDFKSGSIFSNEVKYIKS